MTKEDLAFARQSLDAEMMQAFGYDHP